MKLDKAKKTPARNAEPIQINIALLNNGRVGWLQLKPRDRRLPLFARATSTPASTRKASQRKTAAAFVGTRHSEISRIGRSDRSMKLAICHAKRLENAIRDHSFPSRIIGSPDALAHRAIHYVVVLERSPESCRRRLRHHGLDNFLTTQFIVLVPHLVIVGR